MQVGKDKVVSIDYTLTNNEGQVLDTSKGRTPLTYLHGQGQIVPGLENALEGKASGDAVQVSVAPGQAYGEHDPRLVQPVPRQAFQGVPEVRKGMQFQARSPQGTRVVTVVDVQGENVIVDANHPLAGHTLNFDVTVVEVRPATQEELDHGHVHGDGGHNH